MPKVTKLKINALKITGATRTTSKSGRDLLVIDIQESRIFQAQSGALYFDFDLVELQEPSQYGDTHFITESQTKEEREARVKSTAVGSGKEFGPFKRPGEQPKQQTPPHSGRYQSGGPRSPQPPPPADSSVEDNEDDEIPF